MKTNYQLQVDKLIEQIPPGKPPTLLLHSCCGPCSTYVLSYLTKFFNVTVYFYNPNIMPPQEYSLRLQAQKDVLNSLPFENPVHFVEEEYDVTEFLNIAKGYEAEPERGKRCDRCMALRIEKCAQYAAQNRFDYFCTTLSVSPHKDADLLNQLSRQYSLKYDIPFLPADFKKKGGFLESVRLSKELDIYRQDYCGCIFSKQTKSDD